MLSILMWLVQHLWIIFKNQNTIPISLQSCYGSSGEELDCTDQNIEQIIQCSVLRNFIMMAKTMWIQNSDTNISTMYYLTEVAAMIAKSPRHSSDIPMEDQEENLCYSRSQQIIIQLNHPMFLNTTQYQSTIFQLYSDIGLVFN